MKLIQLKSKKDSEKPNKTLADSQNRVLRNASAQPIEEMDLLKSRQNDFMDGIVFHCRTSGAKSPYYLMTGDGYKTLYYRFTNSAWSNINNTCGWNESSNRSFTAPFSNFKKYQMMIFSDGNGKRTYYSGCDQGKTYTIKTKPGYKYYIYVNDTRGDHEDNHGTISFCYGVQH